MNSLYSRTLCAKIGYIGPVVLEKKILNFVNAFLLFRSYLFWEESVALHMNIVTWIPFTQGWVVSILVEIDPVVLEKKIFKFRHYIFAISRLSPLDKGLTLHLNKLESSFPKNALSLVEIVKVILKKKVKMWKVYEQTDGRQGIRKAHFSFELKQLYQSILERCILYPGKNYVYVLVIIMLRHL